MSVETIARRYASALADVAIESGQEDSIKSELRDWESLIIGNAELNHAFSNPSIAHLSKERLLEDLINRAGSSKTTSNFLRVLLRNSRITELSSINERLAEVLDERKGLTSATVVSARPLSEEEKSDLKESLHRMTGKDVSLEFSIDESVIGGAVTRLGSTVYDGSVKTQLELLKQQMIDS